MISFRILRFPLVTSLFLPCGGGDEGGRVQGSGIPLRDPACSFKQVKLIVGSHRIGSKGSGIKIAHNGGRNLCEGKELIFFFLLTPLPSSRPAAV
jgi:hypothetical protein